jgi:mRNA-degrading endonuclease RelE of RelBE toxin-antitoxin system
MKYFTSPLFRRIFKKLDPREKEEAKRAIAKLAAFFNSGRKAEGLGLKRLHGNFWEIRASISDRILFSFEADEIFFLLAGNHDDIRRFLKHG